MLRNGSEEGQRGLMFFILASPLVSLMGKEPSFMFSVSFLFSAMV